METPSNNIYQAYFCAGEPPETAHISDCPSLASPGQSIVSTIVSTEARRFFISGTSIIPLAISPLTNSQLST
jgi:hypothetical protein